MRADALIGMPYEQAQPLFDAILNDYEHLFVGYLSTTGTILDENGNEIEKHLRPGDSISRDARFMPPVCMRGVA